MTTGASVRTPAGLRPGFRRCASATGWGAAWLLPFAVASGVFLLWSSLNWNIPFYYDDIPQIVNNPAIREPFRPWAVLQDAQRPGRIIQNLSFAFNWWVSRDDPWSYHVVNNLVHALNTALAFLLTARLTRDRRLALFVALLFGLHPLQLQAVTYVMGRVSLLQTFFYLAIVSLFLRRPRPRLLVLALLLVALAVKETCILIPPLLLGIDLVRRARIRWREHALNATQIVIGLPLIWYFSRPYAEAIGFNLFPVTEYLLVQLSYVTFYLRLFVDPSRQSIIHPYPAALDAPILVAAAIGLLIYAVLLGALLPRRDRLSRGLPVLWALVAFVPYHSLLQYVNPFAEYRLYQCTYALALGVGFALRALSRHRFAARLLASAVLIGCTLFTAQMHAVWRSPAALYGYAQGLYPDDVEITTMVGLEAARRRDLARAERELARALAGDWTHRTIQLREGAAVVLGKVRRERERGAAGGADATIPHPPRE